MKSSDDENDDTDASKDADDSMMSRDAKPGSAVSFSKALAGGTVTKDQDSESASKCNSTASSSPPLQGRDPIMKDDLRSHSIAALRAKAMEHSAKVMSQSSSLGPVPSHPAASVVPTSLSVYPSLDRPTSISSYPFHAAASRPIY